MWQAALATVAGSYLMGQQQKKSNQASIDAMSAIANRPQQTALGSYFNPGGMSGLSPYIQDNRAQLLSQMPGYKSTLAGGYNTYLGGLGGVYKELTGTNPFRSSFYNPVNTMGPRPADMTMPSKDQFTTRSQPANPLDYFRYGGGMASGSVFDQAGYDRGMGSYNSNMQSQSMYDQAQAAQQAQFDEQVAQLGQGAPTTGPTQESQFMTAALRPLYEGRAQETDRLTRDFGRRGIGGSSLANNQLGNVSSIYDRQLADTTANVRQQQLAQQLGIHEAALNAGTGLINNFASLDHSTQQVLSQQAAEQLNLLGLSQAQVSAMMQPLGLSMQNNNAFYDQMGKGMMAAGGMFGSGNPFTGSNYTPMNYETYP